MTANEKRQSVAKVYSALIGRNYYSQERRDYCFRPHSNGRHYNDCNSSVCYAYKEAGQGFGILNTAQTRDWFWFDGSGRMVTNTWYWYQEHWYYLGSDGAMMKDQITVDGKWYVMDNDGKMVTDPVTLTPDKDGALRWPELAE